MPQNLKLKIVTLTVFVFLSPFFAMAQFTDSLGSFRGIEFRVTNLLDILNRLACWFIRFGIIAVSIMIVVYGIMFLLGRGNPQGFTSAKKALSWGLVGALVIFGVFTIILSVAAIVGVSYNIVDIVRCP